MSTNFPFFSSLLYFYFILQHTHTLCSLMWDTKFHMHPNNTQSRIQFLKFIIMQFSPSVQPAWVWITPTTLLGRGQLTNVLRINISLTPIQQPVDDAKWIILLPLRPLYTNDQYSRVIMNNIVGPSDRWHNTVGPSLTFRHAVRNLYTNFTFPIAFYSWPRAAVAQSVWLATGGTTEWSSPGRVKNLHFSIPSRPPVHRILRVRSEVFTAVTMKNTVFEDIKTQFVPNRRHITSPLHSPAG
jgi:hypothetical protein